MNLSQQQKDQIQEIASKMIKDIDINEGYLILLIHQAVFNGFVAGKVSINSEVQS